MVMPGGLLSSMRSRPLSPDQVEAIRERLGQRDATLMSVLAYAGPRPAEALKLVWQDVRERTLGAC
jgi:integrase